MVPWNCAAQVQHDSGISALKRCKQLQLFKLESNCSCASQGAVSRRGSASNPRRARAAATRPLGTIHLIETPFPPITIKNSAKHLALAGVWFIPARSHRRLKLDGGTGTAPLLP